MLTEASLFMTARPYQRYGYDCFLQVQMLGQRYTRHTDLCMSVCHEKRSTP